MFIADIVNIEENEINQFMAFHRNKEKKKNFISFLVSIRGLATYKGVNLCSTTLCKEFGVTPQTILNWLKQLCELHIIELSNDKWCKGRYSKRYKFKCHKLFELFNKYRNKKNKSKEEKITIKKIIWKLKHRRLQKQSIYKMNKMPLEELNFKTILPLLQPYVCDSKQLLKDISKIMRYDTYAFINQEIAHMNIEDRSVGGTLYYTLKFLYKIKGLKKDFTRKKFKDSMYYYEGYKDTRSISSSKRISYKVFRSRRTPEFEETYFGSRKPLRRELGDNLYREQQQANLLRYTEETIQNSN